MRYDLKVDVVIATVIFFGGLWLGMHAVRAHRAIGDPQYFYQSEFGPAVMAACGRDFQNPDVDKVAALAAFLSERSDALNCAELPAEMPVLALDQFQLASRYLELTVSLIWKLTGVSWTRLVILPGLLFGAVAAINYGVFRLGLSRTVALLGIGPIMVSTSNLMLVPHIRDYAKGPFLLAVIWIMGLLVTGSACRRRAIALCALGGAVVGLGLGFRTDLLIAVFPFLFTVAFLLPPAASIRTRVVAIAVFLTSFAVVGFPVLRDYSKGRNIGHLILLGLTAPFDRPLGIRRSVYEYGGQYNDTLAASIINSYAVRVEGRREGVGLATLEYEHAANKYLEHIGAVMPADLVTRTLGAMRAVPGFFLEYLLYPPNWVRSESGRGFYRVKARAWSRLAPLAVPAVAASTIVIGMVNPRAAWLILIVMVGFGGASAVQFNERHFYYLELVPWWAFGLLTQTAMNARTLFRGVTRLHIKRAMVIITIVFTVAGAAVVLSRVYQQKMAGGLFESYERARRTSLAFTQRSVGVGHVLLAFQDWLDPLAPGLPAIQTRFLAVEFRDERCGPMNVPLTVRYQSKRPDADLSESMTLPLRAQPTVPTRLFLAIFDRADESIRFRGIEVAAEQAQCVAGLSFVEGLERTPLLLTTILPETWRNEPLYQRLR